MVDGVRAVAAQLGEDGFRCGGYSRQGQLRFVPEPDRGLADDLQFTFNGRDCHGIRTERLKIPPGGELLDHPDGIQDVRKRRCGAGLKDKNRLALRSFKHLQQQHRSVRQIRLDA